MRWGSRIVANTATVKPTYKCDTAQARDTRRCWRLPPGRSAMCAALPQPSGQWGYGQADNQAEDEGQGKGWEG